MAGSALSPVGTLSYNGFTFSSPNTDIASFSMRPVLDDAQRTVTHVEYTLGVVSMLQSDAPTTVNALMANAHKRLGRNGGVLTATGLGLGLDDLTVNSGSVRDAKWGPITQELQIEMRGPYAARIMWVVQFNLPICTTGTPKYTNALMAYNYATEWSIDRDGYTTVTRTGYIEVPMTRVGVENTSIPDTADAYRSNIVFPHIAGFERTHRFTESPDKRRLSFTITDTELATVPPAGFTDFTFDHDIRTKSGSFVKYEVSLSVSGTLANGQKTTRLWEVWETIHAQYVKPARDFGTVVPEAFAIRAHKAGGLPVFAIDYTFSFLPKDVNKLGTIDQNIDNHLRIFDMPSYGEGLVQDVTKRKLWTDSVLSTQTLDGRAKIRANKSDDRIVDLCTTLDRGQGLFQARSALQTAKGTVKQFALNANVPKERSWVEWDVTVELFSDEPYTIHRVDNPLSVATGVANAVVASATGSVATAALAAQQIAGGMTITARPAQTWYALVTVNAERMNFPIPEIQLLNVATKLPVLIEPQRLGAQPRYNNAGMKMYQRSQRDLYIVPDLQDYLSKTGIKPEQVLARIGPLVSIPPGKSNEVEVKSQ